MNRMYVNRMNVGAGYQTASIPLPAWEQFYTREYDHVKTFAGAIEELDYFQLPWNKPSCPSSDEALKEGAENHIGPLINRIFQARVGLSAKILKQDPKAFEEPDPDESYISDYFTDDTYEDRSLFKKVLAVEQLADRELNSVQAFLADTNDLARLRYPDLEDRDKNIRSLALGINDAHVDGLAAVTYIVGARANLEQRFENIMKLLQDTIVRYKVELSANEIMDVGRLRTWFPDVYGEQWPDAIMKLIRWSECWLSGLEPAFRALQEIGPVPDPQSVKQKSRWGPLGRAAQRLRKSFSGILPGLGGEPKGKDGPDDGPGGGGQAV
ncbi:hypothetical protein TWF696_005708 [Orbilia brochopaga]|uniref:Uncharacterized protein n=1 Tax=Orbilia brochopaga TaxID=3140254 RepID=A0AAV9UX37_9PEZI